MLSFKSPTEAEDFECIDPRLQFILYAMAGKLWAICEKPLVVTSVYRDNSSTHKAWRGADVRTKSLTEAEGDALVTFTNKVCSTGVKHRNGSPMLVAHDERKKEDQSVNATNEHIHVQVASNTATKLLRA